MKNISISLLKLKEEDYDSYLSHLVSIRENFKNLNITIHFDVMDNIFVPNTGIDINKIARVKEHNIYIDTHLMVENPKAYIDAAIKLGSNDITIHYEIKEFEKWLEYLLEKKMSLNGNLKIGVSVKPKTDIKVLNKYMDKIDKILVMSVEPGFGGQKYLESANGKIAYIKNNMRDIFIQVDGGINNKTIERPIKEGADSLVIGSYLTDNLDELDKRLSILNSIVEKSVGKNKEN